MTYQYSGHGDAFDPTTVPEEDRRPQGVLPPPGWHTARIASAAPRDTNAGGRGISVGYDLGAAGYVYGWINTAHPTSERCVAIGRRELYQLTAAIGNGTAFGFRSPSELVGRELDIRIVIYDDPKYGPTADIKGYRPVARAPVAPVAPVAPLPPQVAPVAPVAPLPPPVAPPPSFIPPPIAPPIATLPPTLENDDVPF